MAEITLNLSTDEVLALEELARAEGRTSKEQVAHIIRLELQERGFIKPAAQMTESNGKKIVRLDEVMGNTHFE